MSKTATTKEQNMSTTAKAQQIVINIHTLVNEGHTIDQAIEIIARQSNVSTDTIVKGIGFALYA